MSWPLTYTTYGQLLDDNLNPQDSSAFTGPHPVSAPAELRGAGGTHYTLAGKELDTESGLTNFGARYYNAATAGWQTRDPLPGPLTDPMQRNRYTFNRANPVRFVDPYGLMLTVGDDGGCGNCGAPRPANTDDYTDYYFRHRPSTSGGAMTGGPSGGSTTRGGGGAQGGGGDVPPPPPPPPPR